MTKNTHHGMSYTRVYRIWAGKKDRCKNDRQGNYGKRGIKVCQEWKNSFEQFLADMGEPPSPEHSIDRIDVNGNYEPSNCRWATNIEQARNTTKNTILTHNGISKTISEWSEDVGISATTICSRIYYYNWPVDKALTCPVQKPLPKTKPWTKLGMSRSAWYRERKRNS